MPNVVVVGAGIVGSSVAYHLARKGAPVTLIEQAPSPAAGVTGNSFAWIGDVGGTWPGGAEDLRASVLMDYRRLEAELSGMTVRWTGSLAWTDSSTHTGDDARPGRGQHWVTRSEIAALEPNLKSPPERAVHTPTDGGIDPLRTTRELVRSARKLGAQVVFGTAATRLKIVRGRVEGVLSSAGFHPASTVVLAAGTNVPDLCEPLGITLPVAASPAFLVRVATTPGLVRTIIAGPRFEARELRDGHLLMTAPYAGGLDATALHQRAHFILEDLHATFGGNHPVRLREHHLGMRPMPPNGPLVGYVTPDKSVYVAVMHSAVTLAPTIGRLVADEIVGGEPVAELGRCRPLRFSG